MNSYQWIWQYVRIYWKRLIVCLMFILANAGLIIINPLLSGKIVDDVIGKNQLGKLIPILLLMIVITFVRTIFRYSYQIIFESVGQDSLYKLRSDLYKKLQELDFDFFNNTRVGDIMARMTGDTDAIRHFVSWVVYNIIECILWFVIAIGVMTTINWKLMLALVAITPLIFLLTQHMARQAHPIFYEIRESFSRLNSMVEENISGNRVVKAFAREDYEIEKFNHHNDDYKKWNIVSANVSKKHLPVLDSLASVLTVTTMVYGGFLTIKGEMTLGDLVAFNSYLWMLNQPMRMSGWLINDVQRFNASSIKIRQMLATKPKIPVAERKINPTIQGYVEFQNVSFHYSDDPDTYILKDINLSIKPGQTIGILGETGSGKSTMVNLIARFYDPTAGRVLIDGVDAKDWPVRELRDHIAMVMQDVFLFSDTIEDNIAFGTTIDNQDYVRQMAEVADANSFIERMPEGYQTIVGERGVGLSGGQKQRISLARALAKDPAVLILDDTTSAVDMETESKIQTELDKITTKKTTFVIAHRVSSVREADEIIVLSHGKIIERGTHQTLLAKRGYYFDIFQKQLGVEVGQGGLTDGT